MVSLRDQKQKKNSIKVLAVFHLINHFYVRSNMLIAGWKNDKNSVLVVSFNSIM